MTMARLPDAPWRHRPGFDALCALLGAADGATRLVGGAVLVPNRLHGGLEGGEAGELLGVVALHQDVGQRKARGVMHCFSGGQGLADQSLELGFYISFSGIITFKKAEELREVVKNTPIERILVETDSPYLAPIPHRGKRNEPAFVIHTAQMVAQIKNMTLADVARHTTDNFFTLFSKAGATA